MSPRPSFSPPAVGALALAGLALGACRAPSPHLADADRATPRLAAAAPRTAWQPAQAAQRGQRADTTSLTTSLRVTPASVRAGEPFTVRFSLRNRTRRPVQVTLSCTTLATLALRDAPTGDALNSNGCGGALTTLTLAPNREQTLATEWRAEALAVPTPRPLPAGRYVVEAVPTVIEVDGRRYTLPAAHAELKVR